MSAARAARPYGPPVPQAPMGDDENGNWQRPVKVAKGRAYDQAVDTGARRIVATYLAGNESDRREGERFYSRNAHGAARAIASGVDPESYEGRLLRSMPSPGEWRTEVPQGETREVPQSPARKEYEESVRRAAGAIARLSPQTDWDRNVAQAHELQHLGHEDLARLRQGDRSSLAGKELNRQPTENILRAHAILSGQETPEQNIPTGDKRRKIGSFFENIAEPDTSPAVTVDFRAHDIGTGKMLPTSTNRGLSSRARYDMLSDSYTRAADILNAEHPDLRVQNAPLQAKQVQASVWTTARLDEAKRLGARSGKHLHAKGGRPMSRADLGVPVGQEQRSTPASKEVDR